MERKSLPDAKAKADRLAAEQSQPGVVVNSGTEDDPDYELRDLFGVLQPPGGPKIVHMTPVAVEALHGWFDSLGLTELGFVIQNPGT